ncbi:MAG: hypothetical protein LUD72_12640 [Bacteroidales bacterium]|nr:hypothetical protein [Bacteroidales bacterium]
MYRIITKDGEEIATVEAPNYIRKADNGCFVLTERAKADGVAVDGSPYAIIGHELDGAAGEVIISEFDGAAQFSHQISVLEDAAIKLEGIAIERGDMTVEDVAEDWRGYFVKDADRLDRDDDSDGDGDSDGDRGNVNSDMDGNVGGGGML